ncbi:putative calcium/sodium:proton antiporter [Gimesia panareensis]|uniref:Putative calcium/sodium:proton antiporter n=1 Tax=Gimesia panareensis TaxID=2527978 RepID=A0A518FTC0_9PLAN|nr:sodium:calcium antiporter [Gimesia panareensis]QDV19589.1 putative calcium/sodium:proton antiporter [Gimesia panareensis]
MIDLNLPLWGDVTVFLLAALVIGVSGVKLAEYADRLADRTGLGEAITGTIMLGLITALPGLAASVTAALQGHAVLALSNAMGGIAFQTTVLAFADVMHRKANLEHAAASATTMMQTIMLILLISIVLLGLGSPDVVVGSVHPATLLLLAGAGMAFWLSYRVSEQPMWHPRHTSETVLDQPAPGSQHEQLWLLWTGLVVAGLLTLVSGSLVAESAGNIQDKTDLSAPIIGGLLMAGATSLPELVTCLAAVKRGALTLAVSDVVGGNFFDVLFIAAADFAFLSGSLYHAPGVGTREILLTTITLLLNVILLSGLIYRQKHGPGNIGFESVLMLLVYFTGFVVLSFMH